MNANALAQEGSARDESASKTAYGDCLDEVLFFLYNFFNTTSPLSALFYQIT